VATTTPERRQDSDTAPRPPRWRPRSVSLADAADRRRDRNNFDLLRLLAATFVVFAHSFDLLYRTEPFPQLGGDINWGFVGVLIFFSISGFLVTRSWARNPRLVPFATKRALRLMPGLIVAVLLSALVLGPLVASVPLHIYLREPGTKLYILNNVELQTNYLLPGVFLHTVYPFAVNGSLWTLPLEVKAYVFVAIAGVLGLITRWRPVMLIVFALAVLACVNSIRPSLPLANHLGAALVDIQAAPLLVHQVSVGSYNNYLEMFAVFAGGAALYCLRSRVALRWDLAAIAAVGVIVAGFARGQWPDLAVVVLGPYLILCLAYLTTGFARLPRWAGDYSYGTYVYAFPAQQTISSLLTPTSGWVLFVIALPVTLVFAVLSWHFVERPALNLKTRLTGGEQPAGEAV
jgi:peptidoglycan/LPS O-acetylase OafA/YrhL